MKTEIVQLLSTDKLQLPGILYSPDETTRKVAIFLHGNGDSGVFYNTDMINQLGSKLSAQGIAFLAFNNRGARYRKKLIVDGTGEPGQEDTVIGGAHYELMRDCVKDIDGAINFLEKKGFQEFYLLGFSTGANKICVYDALTHSNRVAKYVHAGPGDDSGLYFNENGENHFWLALEYAKAAISSDKPLKVMPKYTRMHSFSAQSAYDILDPNGLYNTFPYFEASTKRLGKKQLFKEYRAITKPQLVLFGENDEFTYTGGGVQQTLGLLQSVTNIKSREHSTFEMIPKADHGFHGKEKELAIKIADWLTK